MRALTSPAGHLKGFAHVITALKRVRATPIMVFDHPTARLPEKMQEHKRRLDLRALNAFRCKVEASRSPRLDALLHAVDMYEQLHPMLRWDVSFALCGEPVRKDDALLAELSRHGTFPRSMIQRNTTTRPGRRVLAVERARSRFPCYA